MTDKERDLTPMLAQYHHFKSQYRDCLLFFRLGDFYELFYEDAKIGSRELNLVLTSRPAGKGRERIPMCGVPYHSANSYIQRLVQKGYKIAICEQVEDPSKARGIVKRDVVRVITPGTYFEKETGGLACVHRKGDTCYVAYLNLSVGEFLGAKVKEEALLDLISKFNVREILVKRGEKVGDQITKVIGAFLTEVGEEFFEEGKDLEEAFGVYSVRAFGFEEEEFGVPLRVAYRYVRFTQKGFLPFLKRPRPYTDEGYVRIDLKARKGLELLESLEGRKDHTLLSVLDRTLTGMGRRRLRFYIQNPLRSVDRIKMVQEAVEELVRNREKRRKIREILGDMGDLERLVSRISSNMATPRDMVHLKNSLKRVEELSREIGSLRSTFFRELAGSLEDVSDIVKEIDRVLVDDPPIHLKEGGLIKDGVDSYLDELRFIRSNAEKLLKDYEARLRKETGIGSLKIGYNRVMGYYIEVTKPNLRYVPDHFRRRQTLSNAERFTTEELQELEEKILSAQTRINDLEYEIFVKLRENVLGGVERIGRNAQVVGEIDYVQSLAEVADTRGWVRPEVNDGMEILIEEGKHPVIENFVKNFVPNDTRIDERERTLIITGPNMAGKSSYIRQVALIVILAQMGSFVPAKKARIGVVDAVFTRIGSGDVLALGVSTFMNEMLEVANILSNATERSLIVLDEVGRGTSTYDGIAISRAVVEHITREIGARTLVATHFLELTDLEREVPGVVNYHMAVSEEGDRVVFLYTLVRGRAEGSFGVEVAKMAGVPEKVTRRAKEILMTLENRDIPVLEETLRRSEEKIKEREAEEILRMLEETDIANLTPLQALIKLAEMKERLSRIREGR
ncbi:MAG: DNA mismatch repair protein MutS [Aquificota bacterium]|nr:DNA mismatch repair protein MutS [Aquificota bacterium]